MKLKKRFSLVERESIVEKSQACLWSDDGKEGLEYLLEHRKLSEDAIRQFGLGYIPNDIKHQLAGRIILPIWDASDNLIAISSRRISENNDLLPVYWHESYEKSFYLYGIQNAKEHIRQWDFAIVVEGQFDVIQLHNHGMKNTVGLCSTNLDEMQLSVIYRYSDQVVLLFDEDENLSGQEGIQRAMKTASKSIGSSSDQGWTKYGYKIVPVSFGENTDPDEFVCKYGG